MQHILLHGGMDETYDRSVVFARRLAESFGAELDIVYTVDDPVGWVEEIRPEQLPVQAPRDRTQSVDLAHALISHGKCAVLVLR